ncbi:MAG: ATP-binding protein, partial [Ktedonobacteraceae bacterium]|nr:ATP-binding protein [Ktedonobacteraceae bacterium]
RAFAFNPQGNLLLYGPYGLGKTHLLAALANLRRAAGRPCLFASAVTLFDAIQEQVSNNEDYHRLIKQAIQTPLLLLDDPDKPKWSEFREEIYYQLIDGRTRRGLPLALASNCAPAELDQYIGGAARSRLMMGMIPVPISGSDYRMEPGGASDS